MPILIYVRDEVTGQEVVVSGSSARDFERTLEVLTDGNQRTAVFRKNWKVIRYNRTDLHPVEVMRAIAWRCPKTLTGTSADAYIRASAAGCEFPLGLQHSAGGVFVYLKDSGELWMDWDTFEQCNPGWQWEEFFFCPNFGVVHILDQFHNVLKCGLDRFPVGTVGESDQLEPVPTAAAVH